MDPTSDTNKQRPETAAASAPANGWAIELEKINKRFGPVHANKDIDLAVARGTIHGIVGENGAGKSTLMSILYGFYTADSGTIKVNGQVQEIGDSSKALSLGIGMVHQHFMLVDNFTVLENVVLGAEDSGFLAPSLVARPQGAAPARGGVRSARRPRCADRGYLRRPAAARRDLEGALSRRRNPHPRRADRRADAPEATTCSVCSAKPCAPRARQ
jgi:ABC-type sugar transport system ATPase subunit